MKIKILTSWGKGEGKPFPFHLDWNGVEFDANPDCREYDWLMVYDEFPRNHEVEHLACPPTHTILVTQEPPSIKIYSPIYTGQFNYVLTTHDPELFPHKNYRRGTGCLIWLNNRSVEENRLCRDFEKTELISAICSNKKNKHTEHFKRFTLIEHLRKNMPDLEWYGWGFRPLQKKHKALDAYKYHLAIENHIHPYHWTEKVADSFLSLCLPFYAGDPQLERVLPPESFIRIPLDNRDEALRIIRKAIKEDEYTKRLPAIHQARRLIIEKYNLWAQVLDIVAEHEQNRYGEEPEQPVRGAVLQGRHKLRRNPITALRMAFHNIRMQIRRKRLS